MFFHGSYECQYFVEVALGIDLVVRECGGKVVTNVEIFDGFVILVNFLHGNAEEGGWFGFEG